MNQLDKDNIRGSMSLGIIEPIEAWKLYTRDSISDILDHYRNNLAQLAMLDGRFQFALKIFKENEDNPEFQEYLKTIYSQNKVAVEYVLEHSLFRD